MKQILQQILKKVWNLQTMREYQIPDEERIEDLILYLDGMRLKLAKLPPEEVTPYDVLRAQRILKASTPEQVKSLLNVS